MRVVSYNVNGIRAAIKKGLIEWLKDYPVDVLCVQETKASITDIDINLLTDLGYHIAWYPAQKKGYSGVAVFSKQKPSLVVHGTGHEMSDAEGRVIRVDFGDLTIINAYFPSGTSGDLRQAYKYQWLDEFFNWVEALRKEKPNIIVAGIIILHIKQSISMILKGIKNLLVFYPKKELGWISYLQIIGWIVLGICMKTPLALILGGVKDFLLLDCKTKDGELIIFVQQKFCQLKLRMPLSFQK